MTVSDRLKCDDLLRRALDLMNDAMWSHIYDENNGEQPGPDCQFSAWITDCESFLTEKGNEGTGSV